MTYQIFSHEDRLYPVQIVVRQDSDEEEEDEDEEDDEQEKDEDEDSEDEGGYSP
jgi:hypothetical protein